MNQLVTLEPADEQDVVLLIRWTLDPVARNRDAIRFFYEVGFQVLGRVELFMDLAPSSERMWKEGIMLHGYHLKY